MSINIAGHNSPLHFKETNYMQRKYNSSLYQLPQIKDKLDFSQQKFGHTSLNQKVQESKMHKNVVNSSQQKIKSEYTQTVPKYLDSAEKNDSLSIRKAEENVQICSDLKHMGEGLKYLWQFYAWVLTFGIMPKPHMTCIID